MAFFYGFESKISGFDHGIKKDVIVAIFKASPLGVLIFLDELPQLSFFFKASLRGGDEII